MVRESEREQRICATRLNSGWAEAPIIRIRHIYTAATRSHGTHYTRYATHCNKFRFCTFNGIKLQNWLINWWTKQTVSSFFLLRMAFHSFFSFRLVFHSPSLPMLLFRSILFITVCRMCARLCMCRFSLMWLSIKLFINIWQCDKYSIRMNFRSDECGPKISSAYRVDVDCAKQCERKRRNSHPRMKNEHGSEQNTNSKMQC